MSDSPIPPETARFLTEHIHSVEQLEILLWMRENAGDWSAQQVATALRTTPASAGARLADLVGRGLLVAADAGRTRYAPADPAADAAVADLAAVYRQAPFAVINAIFSKPVDKIRTFADAFRFRKEDS